MIDHQPAPAILPIESCGRDDLPDVMRIMNSAFDPQFGEAWTLPQCAGILPLPGVTLKVARSEDRLPLGFTLFRTVSDESELLLLAVHPDGRRRGVGNRLLLDFIETTRLSGAARLHLEVRENNPAIHLYRAAAFNIVGRRPNYYRGADGSLYDALTLSRSV